ncbi:MAG: ATP-dependent DNA helicase [Clostridia bacterium]|nr:ATP-dependent DNA helicase [Clostridia bacterium]
MRYDADSRIIKIGLSEFVTIARRGISPSVSHDEDEPNVSKATGIRLKRLIGQSDRQTLCHRFTDGEHNFELDCTVDVTSPGGITVAGCIESNPKRPRKNEIAEIRGEGYISAYIFALSRGLGSASIRFIYYNDATTDYSEKSELISLKKLENFFDKCFMAVKIFARPEVERVTQRMPSMKALKFPYGRVREGQGEFIRGAYRTISRGGCLYATAPTGTGKTVSALYPALRAIGDGRVDKAFYLTPKTTTAVAAKECLELMADKGALIKAVIITAKDKACAEGHLCRKSHKLCKRSACNRIAEAALALYRMNKPVADREDIRRIADEYMICPYELSLTYAELCDVVICDFNYLFDPTVYIKRFFTHGGKFAFLIDEAHNLHERAREMYSAQLSLSELEAPAAEPILGPLSPTKKICSAAAAVLSDTLMPFLKDELREDREGRMLGAATLSEIPSRIYMLFDELMKVVEDEIFINMRADDEEAEQRLSYLRSFYYKTKKFTDIMSRFDSAYKMMLFYNSGEITVKLFCLDTAPVIRERLNKGHGAVLFSATLSPLDYYRSVLGGERSDDILEVNSPFDPSQLSVCIMDGISTRYSEREDTLLAVCRAVAATVSAKRGNYMVFSPSLAYSEALCKMFRAKYPKIKVISQRPDMSAGERAEFLNEFKKNDDSYLIAFCVMGGIYSEGVDLAGEELIGAVIIGIGMPALSYEREAIAAYYQDKYEEGKQYAYIYPGMNRVFQAAGRVIRREDDRGVIVLIDDRFDDPLYKKSLPKLWEGVKFIGNSRDLNEEIKEFWSNTEE